MRFNKKSFKTVGKILFLVLILQLFFAGTVLAISSDAILEMQKRLDMMIEERATYEPWFETRTESTWWKTFWDENDAWSDIYSF